jgi:SNF2 family DNA or RNA helicase
VTAPFSAAERASELKDSSPIEAVSSSRQHLHQVRRSQRDHKTTIVYIDGHPIKKSNNYTVRGGHYVHHDNSQLDTVSPSLKRRAKLREAHAKKAKTTTIADRKLSPPELARQIHNQCVQGSKEAKQDLRRAYLKEHVNILKPFLEDKVYEELLRDEEIQVITSNTNEEVKVKQPKLVTGGILRDYQLEGLTFLVNHHRRNCGMILGDEMGLGEYSISTASKRKTLLLGTIMRFCCLSLSLTGSYFFFRQDGANYIIAVLPQGDGKQDWTKSSGLSS